MSEDDEGDQQDAEASNSVKDEQEADSKEKKNQKLAGSKRSKKINMDFENEFKKLSIQEEPPAADGSGDEVQMETDKDGKCSQSDEEAVLSFKAKESDKQHKVATKTTGVGYARQRIDQQGASLLVEKKHIVHEQVLKHEGDDDDRADSKSPSPSPASMLSFKSKAKLMQKQEELKVAAKKAKEDRKEVLMKNEDTRNVIGIEKPLKQKQNDIFKEEPLAE